MEQLQPESYCNWKDRLYPDSDEKPLDRLCTDGGLCGIFRTIACVGDSLSSGEFEATDEQGNKIYHDMFDYSWGQCLARMCGNKVYNFSGGGMSAERYCESFADAVGCWDPEKKCQAYIVALGVNDMYHHHGHFITTEEFGTLDDVCLQDWHKNAHTFIGYYAQIIQRYKEIQPDARFFLMTMPQGDVTEQEPLSRKHRAALYELAKLFLNTYVMDFYAYAPIQDAKFKEMYYLGGHLNPMGYVLTGKMVASYLDYIIRHNYRDFKQLAFIGTPLHYTEEQTAKL